MIFSPPCLLEKDDEHAKETNPFKLLSDPEPLSPYFRFRCKLFKLLPSLSCLKFLKREGFCLDFCSIVILPW